MTHSLHREGPIDLLEREYVLFVYPARGFNYEGSEPKIRRLAELIYTQKPANMLVSTLRKNLYSGVKPEEWFASIKDGAKVYCVFNNREQLKKALTRIKEKDEGISIMVSGLIDRVREIAAEAGLHPHTINLSLGIQGNKDRLPPPDIRQFTTMCGHGMVSPKLVRDVIRRIKTGKLDFWEGSIILASPCTCGIVNPYRSAEMLKDLIPLYTVNQL
ncbi:MAG: hypothetical protein A2Z51_12055 [Deltaproteobacteria bacterium RBG_19FT_COMBO_52_11]|nr:MAG: hypothetical protein A2Z51_12055 [Deltaproteobacteria bacterium RBG_19FT_COMBO_52_11]